MNLFSKTISAAIVKRLQLRRNWSILTKSTTPWDLAVAARFWQQQVIVIASATGAPAITEAGDYIFRTIPSLNVAAEKLFRYSASKHKSIGVLTEETAYCQGLTEAFIGNNADKTVSIVNENFLSQDSDFRTLLLKLKSKGVEALFLNPQSESGLVTIYKQLQSLKWKVPVYAAYYPGSPAFLDVFGKDADGIIYADLPFNEQMLNERGREVYSEFVKQYGPAKSGEFNITLSYAAFNALHQAIQSGDEVKNYLYKNKFGEIIDGYSFDENGDVLSDKITFVLKTIRGGKPAKLDEL